MTTLEKIRQYMDGLTNELLELDILIKNQLVLQQENENWDTTLSLRERKLAEREAQLLTDTHEVEDTRKTLDADLADYEAKKTKLQSEWSRMLIEKSKHDNIKEEITREKIKLEQKQKELSELENVIKEHEAKSTTKEEMLKKKQKAISAMTKKITLVKQKTEEKAKKIDQIYADIG